MSQGIIFVSSCINESAICNGEGLSTVDLEDSRFSLDELMFTAYGDKLLHCDGGPRDSMWNIGLLLFNVWANTIHCLVVPLVKIYCFIVY